MGSLYPFSIFDPWGSPLCTCPRKYSLNPYTGCSFKCLYCYAASYIGIRESIPKKLYREKLLKAIPKLDVSLPVNLGTSSDPYPSIEEKHCLTRFSIKTLGRLGFKILVTTKAGRLILRDIDVISAFNVAVTPTVTTMDKKLSSRIEPGAPLPNDRLEAARRLVESGVPVGLRLDPIIPGLNDDTDSIKDVLETAFGSGIRFVVTSTYKARPLDYKRMVMEFPEMEQWWRRLYFEEGEKIGGYRYLSLSLRKQILLRVTSLAKKMGMEYATCREGLLSKEYFNARSCDGTHLIPRRVIITKKNKQRRLA